jgi:hypothetical protein
MTDTLKIYVQYISKTIALENVSPSTTILQLKKAVSESFEMPIDQQTLWTNGRIVNKPAEEQNLIPMGVMINDFNQQNEQRTLLSYNTKNEQLFYIISSIYIGTPCYGGMTFAGYTSSLLQTQSYLRSLEPPILIETCFLTNESLITRGRNTVVAKFLRQKAMTHLLFIDADISWQPETVLKIWKADKDMVGAAYPKKGLQFEKFDTLLPELVMKNSDGSPALDANGQVQFYKLGPHVGLDKNEDGSVKIDETGKPITKQKSANKSLEAYIKANLMNYTMNFGEEKQVKNNLLDVKHIGTGFMLIKRRVFEKMMEEHKETKYDDDIGILSPEENVYLYNLFDTQTHPGSDKRIHLLSEDYLFCKNWVDMGGKIYLEVTSPLTHTGTFTFQGHFLASLRFDKNAQPLLQTILNEQVQLESPGTSYTSDISKYNVNTQDASKMELNTSQPRQPVPITVSPVVSSVNSQGSSAQVKPGIQMVKKLNPTNLSQIKIPKRN